MKLSYGYVGAADPEYFLYSTDGTTFQPINLTSSVVTAHTGNVESGQAAGAVNSAGRVIANSGDASGLISLDFTSSAYPTPIKAIRASGMTSADGNLGGVNIVGIWLLTGYG